MITAQSQFPDKVSAPLPIAASCGLKWLKVALQALQGASVPANETGLTGLINEDDKSSASGLIGMANEISGESTADGWALIRYGEWPNERGLQRFGKEQATQMVGYFKNAWNRIKRAFVGMPVLKGHPDFADQLRKELSREPSEMKRAGLTQLINEIEQRYPDKTIYGTIADMEVREDGLAIKPVLTEAGASLVNEQGLRFFSPHWLAVALPEKSAGKDIQAPIYMMSIGLTARPNIAGTSLVNTAPQVSPMNKTLVLKLLAAMGQPADASASDEQLDAVLTNAIPVAAGFAARPEPTALMNEQSARNAAEAEKSTIAAKLTAAETALVNEQTEHVATRKARNEALVGAAVSAGRITEAQKPIWLGRLERDYATESIALVNEQGAVKVTAKTNAIGARKQSNSASDKFTALVNEAMPKHANNWDSAWAAVKASPEGKALYEMMNSAT
jgi:hypothetical protein